MQTNYSINQAVGRPGLIADSAMVKDVQSFINKNGAVKFGCAVCKDDATDTIKHPAAATDITDTKLNRGIVVASHEMESVEDGQDPGYQQGSVVPVLRKGRIWVVANTEVQEGTDAVNCRYAGTGQKGSLGGDAVSMETAVFPNAVWRSSGLATELVILEVDLP